MRAPRKVSSAAVGGCATPMTSASQPTVAVHASAPGSHRPGRSATTSAADRVPLSQARIGPAPA
jgi:hypothetical protein